MMSPTVGDKQAPGGEEAGRAHHIDHDEESVVGEDICRIQCILARTERGAGAEKSEA
jgi:hypothetical protein